MDFLNSEVNIVSTPDTIGSNQLNLNINVE